MLCHITWGKMISINAGVELIDTSISPSHDIIDTGCNYIKRLSVSDGSYIQHGTSVTEMQRCICLDSCGKFLMHRVISYCTLGCSRIYCGCIIDIVKC